MCTALTYKNFFGRNLDWEYSFNEQTIITPKNFPIKLKKEETIISHYEILGVGIVKDNFPFYFDAMNEKGLCMASLNFPKNCQYHNFKKEKTNIAPYELILYVLAKCSSVDKAVKLFKNINVINEPFSSSLGLTPLHFIVADKKEAITVESVAEGLKVYKNEPGVLTNNPPFLYHITNLVNYINLTPNHPQNSFSEKLDLSPYSGGMGAIGLPGDYSSTSRFVKASFVKLNSPDFETKKEKLSQFFHILNSVFMPKGTIRFENGNNEYTVYQSSYDMENKTLYYRTYDSFELKRFDMSCLAQDALVIK